MSTEISEEMNKEKSELLKILRPIDDIFMRTLFRNNKELTEFVLRTITGIPDLEVTEEHSQYDLHSLVGRRSLCLDIFAKDSSGRWYNLEIQRGASGAEPKRARYHSSAIDTDMLKANEDFSELPVTYVIFLTETDFFGEGKLIYLIDRINVTTGKSFNDDEHIIYVNGAYSSEGDDSDLAKLVHDFLCRSADEMLLPIMAENVRYYKINPKGVEYMSKNMDEWENKLIQEGIKKGRQEGRQEGLIETTINFIKKGLMSLEDISECSGLPLDEVKSLAEKCKPAT
ncbi:MAG: Rpn family recombination-promoting nuclease/putative transposase [Ruminococcus sp.]|nr:Rpn family recombination-promoting nuclease/putative transposase [Ruminococcus sp.]